MTNNDFIDTYLKAADDLHTGKITEDNLLSILIDLPKLDRERIERLAQHAESFSSTKPRYGWAIASLVHQASVSQECDVFLQSLSAWYLARACNHWGQPKRVRESISIARQGFAELSEIGWLAACDWQEFALAWTKPSFEEAAQRLNEALTGLEQNGFKKYIHECRLALAYAQILIGEHDEALENIRHTEEFHALHGDELNQARCWLHQASSLRRKDRFEDAQQKLEKALSIFERENAITDQGKALYQMALGDLLQGGRLSSSADRFREAINRFNETELDLWQSLCENNLGSVYLILGQLKEAERHYARARKTFAAHEVLGSLADNLNDSGKLNVLMGRPSQSIELFKQAEVINNELGSQISAAIVISNLGEAHGQIGRYQDALFHLERAADRLESLQVYFRLATCEKYMAVIWSRLGQTSPALEYLNKAEIHYKMADQIAFLSSVYNYRAAVFVQQGRTAEAVEALERSLDIANVHDMRPQAALAKRMLGKALIPEEKAFGYLEQALADFSEMGMSLEQANCLVTMGRYYESNNDLEKAATVYQDALHLSDNLFPEVDWVAHVELGHLAISQGDNESAIQHYQDATTAFRLIRNNFLQPAIAGSYLRAPAREFDRMILETAKADHAHDTLQIIEALKDSTLLRYLAVNNTAIADVNSQELDELKVEIDQLRDQLRVSSDELHPLQTALQFRQKRDLLRKKISQYDESKAKLERANLSTPSLEFSHREFDLFQFRQKASAFLSNDWMILDYYKLKDTLVTVVISPQECRLYLQPLTNRFAMALAACETARVNATSPTKADLQVLGEVLLPERVMELLTPNTFLLISPHRNLHQVPWPALVQPNPSGQFLSSTCIPVVIPSLQSLELLWTRSSSTQETDRRTGLLIGVSSFDGLHGDLPMVQEEVNSLAHNLNESGRFLTDDKATWDNLLKTRKEHGLSHFDWLHIATHFIHDKHTGRSSRIALHDGDIFLDQLRDLSPMPGLVTLSACNSNDSFLYEGDERMDLQSVCFISGANSVIGNAWPVQDEAASELMISFYEYYLSGMHPAKAATLAQRQFIENGRELKAWASFICAGVP